MNELASFAALQRQAGIPATLECVVPGIGEPREELSRVASMVADADLTLAGIFVSPAVHRLSDPPGSVPRVCPSMDQVYLEARRLFPGLHLGGGVYSYFTELNRKRPPIRTGRLGRTCYLSDRPRCGRPQRHGNPRGHPSYHAVMSCLDWKKALLDRPDINRDATEPLWFTHQAQSRSRAHHHG